MKIVPPERKRNEGFAAKSSIHRLFSMKNFYNGHEAYLFKKLTAYVNGLYRGLSYKGV